MHNKKYFNLGKKAIPLCAVFIVLLFVSSVTAVPQTHGSINVENVSKNSKLKDIFDSLSEEIEEITYLIDQDGKISDNEILSSFKTIIADIKDINEQYFSNVEDVEVETIDLNNDFEPLENGGSLLQQFLQVLLAILKIFIEGTIVLIVGIVEAVIALVSLIVVLLVYLQTGLIMFGLFLINVGVQSIEIIKSVASILAPIFGVISQVLTNILGSLIGSLSVILHFIIALAVILAIPLAIFAVIYFLGEPDEEPKGQNLLDLITSLINSIKNIDI